MDAFGGAVAVPWRYSTGISARRASTSCLLCSTPPTTRTEWLPATEDRGRAGIVTRWKVVTTRMDSQWTSTWSPHGMWTLVMSHTDEHWQNLATRLFPAPHVGLPLRQLIRPACARNWLWQEGKDILMDPGSQQLWIYCLGRYLRRSQIGRVCCLAD